MDPSKPGKYADAVKIRTYPSGQRRTVKDPPPHTVAKAFEELGTYSSVASAFGVTRRVVSRWISFYGLNLVSMPGLKLAMEMRTRLARAGDREIVGQWLMDEGCVTVGYFVRTDSTILIVCGSMNDFAVLSRISSILVVPIVSSKNPGGTTLPMGSVRVQGARAYALLQILKPHLRGLKLLEAEAALRFFPASGTIPGRHTTDEIFATEWDGYARSTLREWNLRRRFPENPEKIEEWAVTWVEGRIRRARRFVDGTRQN
jgi:hypothetical protein